MTQYEGTAFCFGDDINTDYIISSRRKRDTLDVEVLKQYIMEDIRPGFFQELKEQSILVAGENFGCGSAMEVAAQVVRGNGISVILAKSFARSYYRNAVNNGILPVEMDTSGIQEGDWLTVHMDEEAVVVTNQRTGARASCPPFQGKPAEILACGGLVEFVRQSQREGE